MAVAEIIFQRGFQRPRGVGLIEEPADRANAPPKAAGENRWSTLGVKIRKVPGSVAAVMGAFKPRLRQAQGEYATAGSTHHKIEEFSRRSSSCRFDMMQDHGRDDAADTATIYR